MSATAQSKIKKFSVALLLVAVIYGLFDISLFYSHFLVFPATIDDLKYAVGFLYLPLVTVALALGALLLRLRSGSRRLSRILAQVGLILSGGFMIWWTVFERGTLPIVMSPVIFLAVVINDRKESKEADRGKRI